MAFQAQDKSIMLNKKNKEEAFYWSSILILFVINEISRQKLMAVNEIRIVVYMIVWNVVSHLFADTKVAM